MGAPVLYAKVVGNNRRDFSGAVAGGLIAAARAGIDPVMLPARNRRDNDDIPPGARDRLRFVWLDTVDDALAASIVVAAAERA